MVPKPGRKTLGVRVYAAPLTVVVVVALGPAHVPAPKGAPTFVIHLVALWAKCPLLLVGPVSPYQPVGLVLVVVVVHLVVQVAPSAFV